ncbi:MAG: conjugal transfer protein, partial [Clostridium sp.]|nr:conjugal transfer protein [Clostridium sp.]
MLEPYEWKRSRTVLRRERASNRPDLADYYPLVKRLHGQVVKLSPTSKSYVNPLDINLNYSEDE